ncbi:hypothetical protein [Pelagibius sp.]|uniref:hypothetical protein n=1 Tax=Pelagibius sp. TaxID=1931238 RepID=UPI003BAE5604
MGNCLLASPALSDSGSVAGGGTVAAAMGFGNLLTMQPSQRCRWTSLTGMFATLDLGAAAEIDTLYFGSHNGSNAATVQVRAAASEANLTAAPGFDTTYDLNVVDIVEDWPHLNSLRYLATAESWRWWRFDFVDAANPAGHFDLGRLALAKAFRPSVNFDFGSTAGWVDNSTVAETLGANLIPTEGGRRRVWELLFNTLPESEAWGDLFEFDRLRGLSRDLVFAMDPEETSRLHQRLFTCLVRSLSPISPNYPGADGQGNWVKRYRIEELV